MGTLHRAQLLLESEQHEALVEIAELEGRSVSDLVREIVRRHLAERAQQIQQQGALQAIERLTQIRAKLREEHGVIQGDPLAEVRAEWERDVERIWGGEA
jgi:Arc/MetJ-type ribon-helix-helix transcriptional regulator